MGSGAMRTDPTRASGGLIVGPNVFNDARADTDLAQFPTAFALVTNVDRLPYAGLCFLGSTSTVGKHPEPPF